MDTSNGTKANAENSRGHTGSASGCCGGPAPAGTSACCAQDAAVKSTGGTGCGCGSAPRRDAPAKVACCSGNGSSRWDDTHTECERSVDRACPIESSWSRDHEDGGPTIQLPAAEVRCTLSSSELRSVDADARRHSNGAEVEFAVGWLPRAQRGETDWARAIFRVVGRSRRLRLDRHLYASRRSAHGHDRPGLLDRPVRRPSDS